MWKALLRKCVLLPKTLNKNKIMNELKFSESEIPYEELANFGLSQEMIDDFPESIMNKFLSGQRTPLLPIERADFDGVVHKDFARIRLQQTEDGLHPVFLPLIAKNNLEYFTEEQKTALQNGQVLKVLLPSNNSWNYVQLDGATNATISVKTDIIDQNLSTLANKVGLSESELMELEEGKVVTKGEEGKMFSAGIDLNEETGVRSVNGDAQKWQEEKDGNVMLDKYNFGIYGCWTKDDKGMLSYVPEDEYSEEMCVAQDAAIEKAKQSRGIHM